MANNEGHPDGLFRGGFMESGSFLRSSDITAGQVTYNQIVAETGCNNSSNTLDCLRKAPFDALMAAINKTPDLFSSSQVRIQQRLYEIEL
jgi:acetylcholinesterase